MPDLLFVMPDPLFVMSDLIGHLRPGGALSPAGSAVR